MIWIKPLANNVKAGDIVGNWDANKGYYMACVFGHKVFLHKLIWFYVHGVWTLVDHRDRDKSNNRLLNLRESTKAQNTYNQGVRQTNLLGVKGVQQRGRRFRAYITNDYQTVHLGTFDTIEEAIDARQKAALDYQGEFANEDQRTCEQSSQVMD